MVFTAFLLDTQQQSDMVKEKPASSLVLSLGKNNTSIIMWQTVVVDEQSTRSNCLVQGSATFYRQRAIWTRLPQQGDR